MLEGGERLKEVVRRQQASPTLEHWCHLHLLLLPERLQPQGRALIL